MLLFLLLGTITLFFAHTWWIILPIRKRLENYPRFSLKSFQLSDLFAMLLMLQVPFGVSAITNRQSGITHYDYIPIISCLLFATVAFCIWLAAVLSLSEIGIKNSAKRLVTQLLVFPWAVGGGFVHAFLLAQLTSSEPAQFNFIAAFMFAALLSIGSFWLTRNWIVVRAQRPHPDSALSPPTAEQPINPFSD